VKIVLVNPSTAVNMRSAVDVEGAWPPLGLLYLATMLERSSVNVKVIDNGPLGLHVKEVAGLIIKEEPDIVGFHTLSMSSLEANEVAKLVKRELPNAFISRFCCESDHEFKTWRFRSPENVVEELLMLESLGYGQIYFVDDSFTVDERRVVELCRLMRREKIDMVWAAETRVSHARKEMLHLWRTSRDDQPREDSSGKRVCRRCCAWRRRIHDA